MDDLLTSLIGMGVNGVNELPKNIQNQKKHKIKFRMHKEIKENEEIK